jgi:glycosyltransferase involved in cell wall biosynthesis
VIASDSGGLPEIIVNGESGFLVPPGDVEALRNRIRLLLEDAECRVQMGRAAAKRATNFYTSAVVPQIEQVYSQLLSE